MTAQDAVSILKRHSVVASVLALTLLGCAQGRRTHEAEPIASVASALSGPTKLHAFATADGGATIRPTTPVQLGGRVYFGAPDAGGALQLWATDLTVSGTVPVATGFAHLHSLTPFNGQLYFVDGELNVWGQDPAPAHWGTLFVSDGTTAGTRPTTISFPEHASAPRFKVRNPLPPPIRLL